MPQHSRSPRLNPQSNPNKENVVPAPPLPALDTQPNPNEDSVAPAPALPTPAWSLPRKRRRRLVSPHLVGQFCTLTRTAAFYSVETTPHISYPPAAPSTIGSDRVFLPRDRRQKAPAIQTPSSILCGWSNPIILTTRLFARFRTDSIPFQQKARIRLVPNPNRIAPHSLLPRALSIQLPLPFEIVSQIPCSNHSSHSPCPSFSSSLRPKAPLLPRPS